MTDKDDYESENIWLEQRVSELRAELIDVAKERDEFETDASTAWKAYEEVKVQKDRLEQQVQDMTDWIESARHKLLLGVDDIDKALKEP